MYKLNNMSSFFLFSHSKYVVNYWKFSRNLLSPSPISSPLECLKLISPHGRLNKEGKNGLPAKHLLGYRFPDNIEVIVVEINLKNQKWLLSCLYRPRSQDKAYFFCEIENSLDFFSCKLENFILIRDLKCEKADNILIDLTENHYIINLANDPTQHVINLEGRNV